jgi:hypothetical protein
MSGHTAGKVRRIGTERRSWPVPNCTSPLSCSITYTLIGRRSVHRRDVLSQHNSGVPSVSACCGQIRTVLLLTTETRLIGFMTSHLDAMTCMLRHVCHDTD